MGNSDGQLIPGLQALNNSLDQAKRMIDSLAPPTRYLLPMYHCFCTAYTSPLDGSACHAQYRVYHHRRTMFRQTDRRSRNALRRQFTFYGGIDSV